MAATMLVVLTFSYSVEHLVEKINDYFIGLTSEFTPLEQTDIASFPVSEIPEELYVSVHEAYKGSNCETENLVQI